ncbi:MAG TPA: hypothetical protein VK558_08295 [Patescibacteria group bacterium]|nr:hypothetical protein [Patescibacteria group bacterium]
MDFQPLDQGTDECRCLFGCRVVKASQGGAELGHALAVEFDGTRVDFEHWFRRRRCQFRRQAVAFGLDPNEPTLHRVGGDAVGDGVDDVIDLSA